MEYDIREHISGDLTFYEKDTNEEIKIVDVITNIIKDNIFDDIVDITFTTDYHSRKYISYSIQTQFYGVYKIEIYESCVSYENFKKKVNNLLEKVKAYKELVNKDYYIIDTKTNKLTICTKSEDDDLKYEVENLKKQMEIMTKYFSEATALS